MTWGGGGGTTTTKKKLGISPGGYTNFNGCFMSLDTSGWDDIPVWVNQWSFSLLIPWKEQGSANCVMLADFCLWFFIHSIAATCSFFFSAPVHTTRNKDRLSARAKLCSTKLPSAPPPQLLKRDRAIQLYKEPLCFTQDYLDRQVVGNPEPVVLFFWKRCPVARFLGRLLAKRVPFCGMTSCAQSDVWWFRAQVNMFTRHKRSKVLGNVTKWNMETFEGVLYPDSVCV